jgi:hypothetical protein
MVSHRGHHTNPLLLRATTAMAIRVISPGAIVTKGYNSDLPISHTSFAESGTGPHNVLAYIKCIEEVAPTDTLNKFLVFPWEASFAFLCS